MMVIYAVSHPREVTPSVCMGGGGGARATGLVTFASSCTDRKNDSLLRQKIAPFLESLLGGHFDPLF